MAKQGLLLLSLIILFISAIVINQKFQQKKLKLFTNCLVIGSQQVETGTASQYANKINFKYEIANLCEEEKQLERVKIITQQKIDKAVVNQDRFIDISATIDAHSKESFEYVLNLDEEEFKKFHRYSLEIVN